MNHFVNRYSFKTATHRSKIILVILASFIFMEKAKAQGCSDAGICSARGINSANKTDSLKNQIGVSFSYAIAPSAARLCYAAALMAKGLLHPSRVINTRIGVARITTPYSCNREPQATSQTIFSEGIGGIA